MKNKWKNLQKKYKVLLIIALVAVLAGGGITGYALVSKYQHEQAITAQSIEIENQSKELDELQKSSLDLIIDGYLKGDITEDDLKVLDEQFASLENKISSNEYFVELEEKMNTTTEKQQKVKEQLQAIRTKFDTQTAVNALFTVPALNGKEISKELIIADTVDSAAVADIKEKYFVEENADEWQKSINSLISEAETQAKEIEDLKAKLEKTLDKDKKLTKEVNAETVKTLKSDIDKLKNESQKKAYAEQLENISKLYDEKIKAVADKKAKEVGGKAKKQKDGSYLITVDDGSEYTVSNNGKTKQTKEVEVAYQEPQQNNTSYSNNSTSGKSNSGESNGGGGNTTAPAAPSNPEPPKPEPEPEPVYEEPYLVEGRIGSIGPFGSEYEANMYAEQKWSEGYDKEGYWTWEAVFSDGSRYWYLDWY